MVTATHFLQIYIQTGSCLGGGGKVVGICHFTGHIVICIAQRRQLDTQLVSSTCYRSIHKAGLTGHRGNNGSIGGFAALGRCGAGADSDVVHADLIGHGFNYQLINRCGKVDLYDQIIYRNNHIVSAFQSLYQTVRIALTVVRCGVADNQTGHAGIFNGQLTILIEASIIMVAGVLVNVGVGAGLVVGHSNAVLLPNLLLGGVRNAVSYVAKVDLDSAVGDLHIGATAFALDNCIQNTAMIKLNRTLVVLDGTGNSDGIANLQVGHISSTASQMVALNGFILTVCHLHGYGDVLVLAGVGLIHCRNYASQGVLTLQSCILFQRISGIHDLLGSHVVAGVVAGDQFFQSTALTELDVALVVHQNTADGNGIANTDLGGICCATLHTVAQNVLAILQVNVNGDILVLAGVCFLDLGNLSL